MSMDDLIQSVLGGGVQKPQRSSGNLEDILGAIMGGGAQQPQSGGGIEDILGAIMGGGAQQPQSGGGIEDILGAIMGGGAQQPQSSGGIEDIISAILGGGSAQQSASPIIEGVSGKTGLSQMIVQMILSFVMSKLMGGLSGSASAMPGYGQEQPRPSEGLDLDSLLEQMGQDKNMAQELAEQTGLDSQTAKVGLEEILGALGAQRQAAPRQPQPSNKGGLDGLLENW